MVSPPDTTGGFGSTVDASESTEVTDLDDLTDLMLGNLMLHVIAEQRKGKNPCNHQSMSAIDRVC